MRESVKKFVSVFCFILLLPLFLLGWVLVGESEEERVWQENL